MNSNHIKSILIFFLIISCVSHQNYEPDLIGSYYKYDDDRKIEMHFEKDSLTIIDIFLSKGTWKAENEKIWFKTSSREIEYDYKIDNKNGSLTVSISGNDTIEYINTLIKASSRFEYLRIKHKVEFELPKSDENLSNLSDDNLNFNIYAGFHNDQIVVRTDKSQNLDDLKMIYKKYKNDLRSEFQNKSRILIFCDKNLDKVVFDSILSQVKELNKNVYQIYKTDNLSYENDLFYHGKRVE